MDARTLRAAAGSWRDLATRAASAADRPEAVRHAARTFEPELGDLDAFERARLLSTVEEIIDRDAAYVVPLHTSQPYYVPSMLDDGFRWTRPRIDVEGGGTYEPYEDKLREYHALGAGERSEDFLFAEARLVPRTGTLVDSLTADAARFRATYGVGSRTSPGFGSVTLAFDPDTLMGATLLPATRLLGQYGSRAGTIEHLPGIMASRIAIEGGARSEVERYGLVVHGLDTRSIDEHLAVRAGYRGQLAQVLESGHDDRVRGVRAMLHNLLDKPHRRFEHPVFKHNPVEAHVRGLTPESVRLLDVEGGWELGQVAPNRLDLIDAAAARRGVRTIGLDEHREYAANRIAENPNWVSTASDEPRRNTAFGTASLRQRMARQRELHGGRGAES